jgi:PAS domain S-box-containing protein
MTANKMDGPVSGQAEQRYKNLYGKISDGLFQTSPDGRFVDANPAMARILGYASPEELIREVTDIGRQVCASESEWREYVRVLEAGRPVRDAEVQVRSKTGEAKWVSVNAEAIRDERGEVFSHEGIVEDITARKNLDALLIDTRRMEAMGALVGGVAHDFNNILTTVMGYCSLILMKTGAGAEFSGYVKRIMDAADRATLLTQSLLSFSRKQTADPRSVEVNEAVRIVEKLLRRVIGEDIELQTAFSKEKLAVMIADGRIGQLLMNLAAHAREAMPAGGMLSIKTGQVHLGREAARTAGGGEGAFAAIEFSYAERGVEGNGRDRALHMTEVDKASYLSIVRSIVRESQGYVNVAERPGAGATFTIYLPLGESAPGSVDLRETAELRGGNEVILVAEDSADVRQLVSMVLTDFGYKVIEAVDGFDVVEKFEAHKETIDLLLLDIIMPGKNGKEAYVELKKARPDVRAIFMSGYTGDILMRKGIGDEGVPMISKPIAIETLLRQVREILDAKPAQLSLFP